MPVVEVEVSGAEAPVPRAVDRVGERAAGERAAGDCAAGECATGPVLRPRGLHDLRRAARGGADAAPDGPADAPVALHYRADDLLVVSGLPGSGKSTLMRRCIRAGLVDSQQVREEFAKRLPDKLPYFVYRPLVRVAHYRRLRRAVLDGGPVAVHDCGALPWVRLWLTRAAARQGRRVHLILLDATPGEAREGQRARGQGVSAYAFARHRKAAGRLRRRLAGTGEPPAGCASAVVLDRAGARALREIVFVAS
ncbi:AAA family ATPase [Kitasatospora sp. NPDC090091]|uniref:AAA family ATPase n=1 Tax=Kitasatospora sp. NPDC090091 TaxID=3364081 RepID=UPI003826E7B9